MKQTAWRRRQSANASRRALGREELADRARLGGRARLALAAREPHHVEIGLRDIDAARSPRPAAASRRSISRVPAKWRLPAATQSRSMRRLSKLRFKAP